MLESQRFLIRGRGNVLRSHHTCDLHDADSGQLIGTASETTSPLKRAARWLVSKRLTGTRIEVRERTDDSLVFTVSRGWYIVRSRVEVRDAQESLVGTLERRPITWSGGYTVYDHAGRLFAQVKGNLFGYNYRVLTADGAVELGRVTRQRKGLTRELLTTSGWYLLEVNEDLDELPPAKMLVLAVALATDMIFKSDSRPIAAPDVGG